MIKSKKQMYTIIVIFTLVMLLGTITYAFFNYTRTGTANTIKTGRIAFNSSQGTAINLTNMFPIDVTNGIPNDAAKVGTVTINVTGDTTYIEGIEYLVTAVNVSNTIGNGANAKSLPISIDVSVTSNDNNDPETILGTSDADYFTDRGTSASTSIYKVLAKDVLENNEKLLVGYVKSGVTGVDGNIVIKAYLDASKIAISDTYDENNPGADNMGTTPTWVGDRTVLTTAEWNSLQANGVSFQIRVEANEGIWVEEPMTAYTQITRNVNTTTTINFGQISSASNGQGLYILPGTENDTNPIYYYRGNIDNNNVIFGGFCWQMVRTTDTGGIKMIYNGVATDNGTTCTNSTHATRILPTISKFNSSYITLADVGYMNNTKYAYTQSGSPSGSIYGKNVEWDGTNYLLIEDTAHTASTNTTKDNSHHYNCGIKGTASCNTVRYYYYETFYITLSGGDLLEDVIYKMTGNGSQATKEKHAGYNLNENDSTIKEVIDTWFKTNLTNEIDNTKTDYSVYLEDTVFCSDRSFKTLENSLSIPIYEKSGWNPFGGDLTNYVYFGTYNRFNNSGWYSTTNVPAVKNSGEFPNIDCPNETDRFTVSSDIGNGDLTYPVGLLTVDELNMAGAHELSSNNSFYLYTGGVYWTMSPSHYTNYKAMMVVMNTSGLLASDGGYDRGVRPVVSLKPGIEFVPGGEGTSLKPYVVKYN